MSIWSEWKPLSSMKDAPKEPGVYRIRVKDQIVRRLNGEDPIGLLYIGKTWGYGDTSTRTIRGRLIEFHKCASNPKARGHIAGWNFSNRGYSSRFALDGLEYASVTTNSRDETRNLEACEIEAYLLSYLDLPPLNFSVPQAIRQTPATEVVRDF